MEALCGIYTVKWPFLFRVNIPRRSTKCEQCQTVLCIEPIQPSEAVGRGAPSALCVVPLLILGLKPTAFQSQGQIPNHLATRCPSREGLRMAEHEEFKRVLKKSMQLISLNGRIWPQAPDAMSLVDRSQGPSPGHWSMKSPADRHSGWTQTRPPCQRQTLLHKVRDGKLAALSSCLLLSTLFNYSECFSVSHSDGCTPVTLSLKPSFSLPLAAAVDHEACHSAERSCHLLDGPFSPINSAQMGFIGSLSMAINNSAAPERTIKLICGWQKVMEILRLRTSIHHTLPLCLVLMSSGPGGALLITCQRIAHVRTESRTPAQRPVSLLQSPRGKAVVSTFSRLSSGDHNQLNSKWAEKQEIWAY